jgi:PPP family 3-phenylpropionic acid transporter
MVRHRSLLPILNKGIEERDRVSIVESSQHTSSISARKWKSLSLRMLYFFYYGSGSAWFPFFNVYLQQIGLTGVQIGLLSGIRPVVITLGQPVWGVIADVWDRRRVLLLSLLLAAILVPGFGLVTNFWFLFGWTILYAYIASPAQPLVDSVTLDYVEHERSGSFSLFRLWGGLGWAVMAYVSGRFIEGRDIRLAAFIASILLLIAWVVARRFSHQAEEGSKLGLRLAGLKPLLRNGNLVLFLTLVTFATVGMSATFAFFSIYLDALGATTGLIGLAFTVQGFSEFPMYLSADRIIKRLGLRRTLFVTLFIFAVRSLLYAVITHPVLVVALQVLHAAFALFLVTSVQYVNLQVPSKWRATGQSLLTATHMGLGAVLGYALAGYLFDSVGMERMYLISGLIVLFVSFVALMALKPSRDVIWDEGLNDVSS